jgi:hypothetical protein
VTRSKFIRAEGQLQNQEGVIHVKAVRLIPLSEEGLEVRSARFSLMRCVERKQSLIQFQHVHPWLAKQAELPGRNMLKHEFPD